MRKSVLLLVVLLSIGMIAGCGNGDAPASPISSPPPSPTSAPAATVAVTPSGPATCELAPLEFPVNPNIPPVSEVDHVHGPDDASITLIEYADFQ